MVVFRVFTEKARFASRLKVSKCEVDVSGGVAHTTTDAENPDRCKVWDKQEDENVTETGISP